MVRRTYFMAMIRAILIRNPLMSYGTYTIDIHCHLIQVSAGIPNLLNGTCAPNQHPAKLWYLQYLFYHVILMFHKTYNKTERNLRWTDEQNAINFTDINRKMQTAILKYKADRFSTTPWKTPIVLKGCQFIFPTQVQNPGINKSHTILPHLILVSPSIYVYKIYKVTYNGRRQIMQRAHNKPYGQNSSSIL